MHTLKETLLFQFLLNELQCLLCTIFEPNSTSKCLMYIYAHTFYIYVYTHTLIIDIFNFESKNIQRKMIKDMF